MSKYFTKNHSKYSLKYHLVLVTKYRKPVFNNNDINSYIKSFLLTGLKQYQASIIINTLETDLDHIHILFESTPEISVSNIVKAIKQYSTHYLYQSFSKELIKYYRKRNIIWSDGYFICSTGDASTNTIKRYIASQG